MSILSAIIFVTGAAILALELLASRIMTPYFGVSLYIWSGILSITLIALAGGYWGGGRLAARFGRERLGAIFLALPAIAAVALGLAALAYPVLFPLLAEIDLVFGAYLACCALLLVPLAATSAMNPLLVALRPGGGHEPDAGAGRVFFISTLGSVAGVPLAAFGLIPNLTNHSSVLLIGAVLSALSLLAGLRRRAARPILVLAAGGLVFCLVVLGSTEWRLGRGAGSGRGGPTWHLEREYGSLFGSVKILRAERGGQWSRVYYQDGILQNRVDARGESLSLFTHALEVLAVGYKPDARGALVLGLGAGIVPMRLAARGMAVEVVEINPASWAAAEALFGFDPKRVTGHLADARSFVRGCRQAHDVVVVDLFQGDGVPDYLVTREFFADLRRCLRPGGVAVFNSFADLDRPAGYRHFLATAKAAFRDVVLFRRPAYEGLVNSFVVVADQPLADKVAFPLPPTAWRFAAELGAIMANATRVDQAMLRGAQPVSDERNFLGHANAASYMAYRRSTLEMLPPGFLVN